MNTPYKAREKIKAFIWSAKNVNLTDISSLCDVFDISEEDCSNSLKSLISSGEIMLENGIYRKTQFIKNMEQVD